MRRIEINCRACVYDAYGWPDFWRPAQLVALEAIQELL